MCVAGLSAKQIIVSKGAVVLNHRGVVVGFQMAVCFAVCIDIADEGHCRKLLLEISQVVFVGRSFDSCIGKQVLTE